MDEHPVATEGKGEMYIPRSFICLTVYGMDCLMYLSSF